jgi:hypothetical protein
MPTILDRFRKLLSSCRSALTTAGDVSGRATPDAAVAVAEQDREEF